MGFWIYIVTLVRNGDMDAIGRWWPLSLVVNRTNQQVMALRFDSEFLVLQSGFRMKVSAP